MIVFLDKFIDSNQTLDNILFNSFGLNRQSVRFILLYNGLSNSVRLKDIPLIRLLELEEFLLKHFVVNKDKEEQVNLFNENIMSSGSIRYYRRKNRLPVNGQRTHTNAQTQKK